VRQTTTLFTICVALGVALRATCTTVGYNWDAGVLFGITKLPFGANFYREVPFWANWGPVPYTLYQGFRLLPGGNDIVGFHAYVAAFCIACDVLTAYVLWRLWGLRAAAAFLLLSPVAIVISGFHGNAEPILVAIVLLGFLLHVRFRGRWSDDVHPAFLACIGVSLAFKHSFVLFPIWLAMRPAPWRKRLLTVLIPFSVWGACALYYLIPAPGYFLGNVVGYSAWAGNALLPTAIIWLLQKVGAIGPDPAVMRAWWAPLFVTLMLVIGWSIRSWRLERVLFVYPLALISTTSAVALQYFALAMFPLAVTFDGLAAAFSAFTAYFYAGHPDELHLFSLPPWLTDVDGPLGHFSWGWLIAQGIVAAILFKQSVAWRKDERARRQVTAAAGQV
jgi:hypothetical protein